jgi:hypothetical protein
LAPSHQNATARERTAQGVSVDGSGTRTPQAGARTRDGSRRLCVTGSPTGSRSGSAHASNGLFGAGDFAVVQVLAATALGMVFGALRVRTGSLTAPVALHALVNGLNLLA